jgi:hypothetical protein
VRVSIGLSSSSGWSSPTAAAAAAAAPAAAAPGRVLALLVVRATPGPVGIFEGLLDRATTRPRPRPVPEAEDAAEEVDTVLRGAPVPVADGGGVLPVAPPGGVRKLEVDRIVPEGVLAAPVGAPLVVLRAEADRAGPALEVEPHAGLEVPDVEGAKRDEDVAEAVELRELLREIPPAAGTGEEEADVPESLCLLFILLVPVGVPAAPGVPGARPRPEVEPPAPPAVGVLTGPELPERNGGGVVLRCKESSFLGTAGLFCAASIATRGKPPEGRLGLGVPALSTVDEDGSLSIVKLLGFLPGEDTFDLGLTLGSGDTIGPSEETMLLVFEVVLPGEGRGATFIGGSAVGGAASVCCSTSGNVRGDGVGSGSTICSGIVRAGGVEPDV